MTNEILWLQPLVTPQELMETKFEQLVLQQIGGETLNAAEEVRHLLWLCKKLKIGGRFHGE